VTAGRASTTPAGEGDIIDANNEVFEVRGTLFSRATNPSLLRAEGGEMIISSSVTDISSSASSSKMVRRGEGNERQRRARRKTDGTEEERE
jgi:hypothetical protein